MNVVNKIVLSAVTAAVNAVRDRLPTTLASDRLKVDGSGVTQPVSASALPLPTGAATETTLASVLAKIIAAPATEAKQDTGNTSLATLAGVVSAGKALVTETSAAAILAKLSSDPSTATLQTAGNSSLSTLAGIVAAGKAAISAAQLPAALGITTASGSLSVAPASDALFDVKDRAARLLGALTGVNGSSVATGANPVPMQLSDGSAVFTGAKDSTLTGGSMIAIAKGAAATGAAVSGNPVYVGGKDGSGNAQPVRVSAAGNVQVGQAKGTSYSSSAAEISAVVSNTACSPAMISIRNVSGNTRYAHCFNATSVPGSGTVPVFMFMLTANSDAQKTFPIPTDRFGTGLTIVASSTAGTLTASVSSDFLIQVDLYPSST